MERSCLLGSIEGSRARGRQRKKNIWRPLWKALTEIGKPLTWTGWQTEERLDAH